MIELAEVVRELRAELERAISDGADEALRFELGPIELEVSVGLERTGGGGAKVRFMVVEVGGDAASKSASTQRVKLTLQPQLAATGGSPYISGQASTREQ